jgi:hypothetical protein
MNVSCETRHNSMKTPRINQQPRSVLTPRVPLLPQLPERFRGFVNAAYAAYGGAESMKLNDWRDLEMQLNRRLKNEDEQRRR